MKKFHHLDVPYQWEEYWTKYPHGYSIFEALSKWVTQVDDMVDNINDWNKYLEGFVKQFDKNLQQEVIRTLKEWQESGFLDVVIDEALQTQIDDVQEQVKKNITTISGIKTKIDYVDADLQSRGVNAKYPPYPYKGVVGDGKTDDTENLQNLINNFPVVLLPEGIYNVTKPIVVGLNGRALVGVSTNVRGYGGTSTIRYVGDSDRFSSVIIMGRNTPGAEPITDGTNNTIENLYIDCNDKAGFGIYATYLTNESKINNIVVKGSREYNVYVARSWYASISNITSLNCRNVGIAIGVPLVLSDGTTITWQTKAPLEVNGVFIRGLRSMRSGQLFSEINKGSYDFVTDYNKGYGIGIGEGNGLYVDSFISERSGGAGLYVYTNSQPNKKITRGYIENSCINSGLNIDSVPGMYIHCVNRTGNSYSIEDIFMSYNTAGGIYFIGDSDSRKVWLKNIYQPRFLKALNNCVKQYELYSIVLKQNVYSTCGFYNILPEQGSTNTVETVNTRYSWSIKIKEGFNPHLVYIKKEGSGTPQGSYTIVRTNGQSFSKAFPADLDGNWKLALATGSISRIERSGGSGTEDCDVTFMIIDVPRTDL